MQTILFFDLDSTLIENHFSRRAVQELLQSIAKATGRSVDELRQELGDENFRRQKQNPDHPLTMDWDDIIETVASRHDATLPARLIDLWREYANPDEVDILDNAPDVLAELQHPQRKLVLATKGLYKYQEPVLRVTGLQPYFDDILTPDKTGHLKTSPAYFDKYRERDACFIQTGDHYYDDIICAKRNGFHAVLRLPLDDLQSYDPFERPQYLQQYRDEIPTYPESGTEILPDAVVVSLQELPEVVRRIEER